MLELLTVLMKQIVRGSLRNIIWGILLENPIKLGSSTSEGKRELSGDYRLVPYIVFRSGELTKLWNQCPNNLKACKGHERDFMPTLEEYFADAIKQLESSSKDEESVLKDSNMGWRALRLLARKSPHFFTYHNTIFSPLSLYLEMMVKKISHEKKGKDHMDSQNDNEIENILAEEEQATEDLKPNDNEEFVDDNPTREHKNITMNQLLLISEKVAPDWIKLAVKLGEYVLHIYPKQDGGSSSGKSKKKNLVGLLLFFVRRFGCSVSKS